MGIKIGIGHYSNCSFLKDGQMDDLGLKDMSMTIQYCNNCT